MRIGPNPSCRANDLADRATTIARAGVEPTLPRREIQEALRRAIADRQGYVDLDYDEIGWVVFLLSPDQEPFRGDTLGHALSWYLMWPTAEGFGGVFGRHVPRLPDDPAGGRMWLGLPTRQRRALCYHRSDLGRLDDGVAPAGRAPRDGRGRCRGNQRGRGRRSRPRTSPGH